MVVGADHRGPAGISVWRDAATGPLTALRHQPGHGRRFSWARPTAWGRGRGASRPAGAADHLALGGPAGSGTQPGLGPVVLGHREQLVAGKPCRSTSRSDVWCVFGSHPAVAPGTGDVLQGRGRLPGRYWRPRQDGGGYPRGSPHAMEEPVILVTGATRTTGRGRGRLPPGGGRP